MKVPLHLPYQIYNHNQLQFYYWDLHMLNNYQQFRYIHHIYNGNQGNLLKYNLHTFNQDINNHCLKNIYLLYMFYTMYFLDQLLHIKMGENNYIFMKHHYHLQLYYIFLNHLVFLYHIHDYHFQTLQNHHYHMLSQSIFMIHHHHIQFQMRVDQPDLKNSHL